LVRRWIFVRAWPGRCQAPSVWVPASCPGPRTGPRNDIHARDGGNRGHAKHLANRAQLNAQVVLLHHQTGPDEVEQFVLRDDAIAALDKRDQKVERACAKWHRLAVHQDLALLGPDLGATDDHR